MEMLIYGICTHLGKIGGSAHRIALPSAVGYVVPDPAIPIPDHTPALSIFRRDIASDDPEAALSAFRGPGLVPLETNRQDVVAWRLDNVTVTFDGIATPLDTKACACLPHLAPAGGILLDANIQKGLHPASVAAFLDLTGGRLAVEKEERGGLHAVLAGGETAWNLVVSHLGSRRTLPMKPAARVTVSNHESRACDPCSEHDYLLHYRVTRTPFAPAFTEPICVLARLDVTDFPQPRDPRSTLLSCSNSNYP